MHEDKIVEERMKNTSNRESSPVWKGVKMPWMSPAMPQKNASRTQRISKRTGTKEREREMEVDAVSTKANKAYHESRIA